jgi:hypothetical protein
VPLPILGKSAKNARGESHFATAAYEHPQRGDVERGIQGKPDRLECVEAGALELVEAPLDDDVRCRTLEPHANARRSGCRKNHGPAIGSNRSWLEPLALKAVELERDPRRRLAEADQVVLGDPTPRYSVATGSTHGLADGNRPSVLHERDECTRARRDRVCL